MRIQTFSLTNQNDNSKVSLNEQSSNGSNFSGLISLLSSIDQNPTESIRHKLQKSLVMEQQLTNIGESEHLMELDSESLSAFIELLTQSKDGFLGSDTNVDRELNEAIAILVNQPGQEVKTETESIISDLLASLPIEVKINVEQTLQAFQEGKLNSSSNEELSKPESTIALLILLTRSLQDGKKLNENPSVSKLIEFVNRQLETMNLTEIIPAKEDLSKTLKKLVELSTTLVETNKTQGKITEGDNNSNNRSYLQSVFSRYFVEPSKLHQINSMKNQSIVSQTVTGIQDDKQTSMKSDLVVQPSISALDLQVPLTKVQQFALFVEQQHGKQTINQEQFIKEFQNILARSQFGNGKEGMKLLIKLYPEHLGSLRIELLQKDNMMIARIIASSGAAKDVLESQIQSLKQSFLSQNIQVEKIEISQQLQQSERSLQKDSQQNNGQGNRQMNDNQHEESEENQTFESALQEELNVKV
ncbi:flagellar hook-length control protein FliK [Cytobacillus suaedae]|nr:flagellar hook-length control protein FliK [Cytobacillus suaedae]